MISLVRLEHMGADVATVGTSEQAAQRNSLALRGLIFTGMGYTCYQAASHRAMRSEVCIPFVEGYNLVPGLSSPRATWLELEPTWLKHWEFGAFKRPALRPYMAGIFGPIDLYHEAVRVVEFE